MKVEVLVVGRARGAIAEVIDDFRSRAGRYWKLEEIVVEPFRRRDEQAVKQVEGERILSKVDERTELVALTRTGKEMSSKDLAGYLGELAVRSVPSVTFVIGGAFGLSGSVLKHARHRLRLSTMTLPHDLARAVLFEQLYRVGTILRGEPYHKGK